MKCVCEDGTSYLVKYYHQSLRDQRDRLQTEFSALSFLRNNGVDQVPRPICMIPDVGCGVYEFVEGQGLKSTDIELSDIDEVCRFLKHLYQLSEQSGSLEFSSASEAAFSLDGVLMTVETRLTRLRACLSLSNQHQELQRFLESTFIPTYEKIRHYCIKAIEKCGLLKSEELAVKKRTLSPSDCGFHNVIQKKTCGLVFVDFEYFGWDDPVKLMVDFLLHPAMELTHRMKQRFLQNMISVFVEEKNIVYRMNCMYPLFGMKWCLIMLNEFLPDELARRQFAAYSQENWQERQRRQLQKSKCMLSEIIEQYDRHIYAFI
ncbi:MAG: hypothetical protein ACPGYT_00015 [Nitrospirales bacterium]